MNDALDREIAALLALAARKGRPTRHAARPLLLEIGACLLQCLQEEAREARRRLGDLPAGFLEHWEAAVLDEISMAATEHVRSVDPKRLPHPDYDWEYTLEARKRLEARLEAAGFLGIPVPELVLEGIRRADRILREHSAKSGRNASGTGS